MIMLVLYLLVAVFGTTTAISEAEKLELNHLKRILEKDQLSQPLELTISNPQNFKDQVVHAGDSLEMTCEAAGTPHANFRWTLNGRELKEDVNFGLFERLRNIGKKVIATSITVSKLHIPCVGKEHRGIIKCIVNNGYDEKELSAKVTVVGHPKALKCSQQPVDPLPSIEMYTDSRFENEGNTVQVICKTKNAEMVNWYFEDHQRIHNNRQFEILPQGDLLIKNIQWDNMGTYTCVASNKHGQTSISAFVYPSDPASDSRPPIA